jgi:dTMP kinase
VSGRFIVFEGGDGVGKSTQVRLLAQALADRGDVLVTAEPGGTELGERLRKLLLDPATGDISARTEALLYAADKAQHVAQVIRPALERGQWVICDRYVDSMLAYQGAGRTLDAAELKKLADWATGGLVPDLTVLLDLDPSVGVGAKRELDRLEAAGEEFHQRVRDGFLALAAAAPERYLVLPARASVEQIATAVLRRVT